MDIKTKKQAKEMGYCNESVLLHKYGRVPRTKGVTVKNETFYKPELEEQVKSQTAWKKEGRQIKAGTVAAGIKHAHIGKGIHYEVYRESDTEALE